MALQSEVSPPMVGDPNKDTKIEGETKSDDNDSSQSTDEEVDLEEGEILDSGAEEEEEKDFTNSSLKEALDKSCLQNIEQLVNHRNNTKPLDSPDRSKVAPRKLNKMAANYMDHDRLENTSDQEDGWFPDSSKYKSKYDEKPVDYRMELAAYRGTPPSSPERKRRDDKSRKKKSSSKKSKKTRKTIKRKDIRGVRVAKYIKDSVRGRICKFYKEGKCSKGSDCLYSHSAPPPPFKKKELCKFYLNGHCNKGKDYDCRFSHAPLNEEMRRVLADYLKMSHGDDVRLSRGDDRDKERGLGDRDERRDRKRCSSRSPEPKAPPSKRTCLLGSPPRHIREAEETKRWQEEMKQLQQQNHPGFEIHLSPNQEEEGSPTHFPKPNFYQETLLNTPSPKRKQPNSETPTNFHGNSSNDFEQETSSKLYVYDDDEVIEIEVPPVKREPSDEYNWNNIHGVTHPEEGHIKHFNENSQQELDFTNDVKFDETTQFSEMESSTDCAPNSSPDHPSWTALSETKDNEEITNVEKIKIKEEKLSDDESINSSQEISPPSIVIPSHLPRRQQELMMRVLQHQKKTDVNAPSSPSNNEVTESQIKKEESDNEEKIESKSDFKWYSSEDDDDDDSDQPLTAVLKKIQQDPPPKPVAQETKPATKVNLLEMFKQIQQSALEKNKGPSNVQVPPQQQKQPQGSFWDNLFGGSAPSKPITSVNPNPVASEPKRRTLLPDPVSLPAVQVEPKEPVIKDPRLKNRDPRKLANASISTPKVTINNDTNSLSPIQTQNTIATKPSPNTVIESAKESIPYRLRGILSKPPNYSPYLCANQSNPNLLKDPRLRKHLNPNQSNDTVLIGNEKDTDAVKPTPQPKDVPPIPELLLKYEPAPLINIFESSKSAEKEVKPPSPVVYDPRISRRDSHSNSGSDTPPHLTIVDSSASPPHEEIKSAPVVENEIESAEEKKWLPPVLEKTWTPILEKNWTSLVIKNEPDTDSNCEPPLVEAGSKSSPKRSPSQTTKEEFITVVKKEPSVVKPGNLPVVPPLIIKKVKPTPPASHLPRAIADPRMAKLHERRRPLVSSDTNSKSIIERKKQPQPVQSEISKVNSNLITNESESSNSSESQNSTVSDSSKKFTKDEKPKSAKSIPKKRRLSDKNEEKKKPVHRNRKSSMDYASPLNSCDATNDSKNLDYNSYNQRPKRTVASQNEQSAPNNNSPSIITELSDPPIPEFILSDNSNLECDNSSDVNLKDRFKTIDPTASPFC
ncbi:transposon Tf2-6 polyprotein [Trichonephila inaurata madagascariensis]|uniref:Transposon Tf2-6 polyprotein n=1 Tax=Trichonephila inaurata madagascariensis TaxID=2747483 RepID=A0A8X7CS22_9ARAC|nr:transposon Tf2-6 polyprotein [Trichonephila inaurata madagascariensis]